MTITKYGVRLSGKRGHNVIYFKCLNDRRGFLNLVNEGECHSSIDLIEKEVKQEGNKDD